MTIRLRVEKQVFGCPNKAPSREGYVWYALRQGVYQVLSLGAIQSDKWSGSSGLLNNGAVTRRAYHTNLVGKVDALNSRHNRGISISGGRVAPQFT